jgi:2-polyprenyl-3-methyl-5-hydroxy-6-metoxy-1,4-benzoquinol methylase
MARLLIPRRRRGVELLDDPAIPPEIVRRSIKDVERSNVIFGGLRAALEEMKPTLGQVPRCATLLDVGTGAGDIPAAARIIASKRGVTLTTIGFDYSEALLRAHRRRNGSVVRGDARRLPFRDRSIDIVMCSQVLHHFCEPDAVQLIAEMNRVARARVVISDIRRSWIAAGGLWVASFLLGFHSVSRHDGVVSVMRGFVPHELSALVTSATGQRAQVSRRLGFRVTTSWKPE